MIGVIDYGAGNLRNVCKSLEFVGASLLLSDDMAALDRCDKIVLPGVGAFEDCARGLRGRGLWDWSIAVAHSGRPFLGICVGMQLLFERGLEMGTWPGLALLPGQIERFAFPDGAPRLKVPHIGWNEIHLRQPAHPLLRDVPGDGYAYFVHSFHATGMNPAHILATTDYGYDIPAVVGDGNIMGIQFHPEKSQDVGLQMLRNFVN
jgi:imidazole glycerol-phosphate synthase subunit HisH